ncbi:thiolase family protein [Pseudonocardia abyssalis]|uniref:Probable acetyl-CoA acetyltransferase n=1 Tax=Pseudonocardia abyssalis TaxID=2792008 RepID=A0ABS6UR86_9PSEU|nr:acetyl-CoA C-acyltransferase [Pseudonocardia abyssalis]MBW0118729.1 acetyl-CoA C-acyltransferase [Pseudonocardia abyssalis]MBW0134754.1 acetyl-CoA C-acyltransferase [Pseudonocardia abyssalis]
MTEDRPRVALVDGCRTPFARARRELRSSSPLDLTLGVVKALARRHDLKGSDIGTLRVGSALAYPEFSFLARETAIRLGWTTTEASSAEYACGTGLRTAVDAVLELTSGDAEVGIAGGVESTSQMPLATNAAAREFVVGSMKAGPEQRRAMLDALTAADVLPPPPAFTEPYSGVSLAEYAERLGGQWSVGREEADAFTLQSHRRAAAARDAGRFAGSIVPVDGPGGTLDHDTVPDADLSAERLAQARPLFPDLGGLVTAPSASAVTDGAAAVLVATEEGCRRHDLRPLAWIRSWAFTSHDPQDGVLLGPAFALPVALSRAGVNLADLGVIDLHEAFAAQVLANLRALDSTDFARRHLGRDEAVGAVDPAGINLWGGSIALGHPFGATGGRLLTQLAHGMVAADAELGATAMCVGGSRGVAVVLERAD